MTPPLPTIITSEADSRPSTPQNDAAAPGAPITPPTFRISTVDTDGPSLSPNTNQYSPTSSSRTPSPNLGGYSTSEGPPSPTGSADPFVAKSSLGLRDNNDVSL